MLITAKNKHLFKMSSMCQKMTTHICGKCPEGLTVGGHQVSFSAPGWLHV